MKVKVEKVTIGKFDYDSILVMADHLPLEIVFKKSDNVARYDGKVVELTVENGIYKISAARDVVKRSR